MADPQDLAARVAELERTVALLERRLAGLDTSTPRASSVATHDAPSRSTASISLVPDDPGQWAGRLGITLLLLGAAFGFKYSVDRGWIGPAVRVVAGLTLGALLVATSSALRTTRPGLSRLLAGGGIAAGYLSIYAAFQLYALVSYGVAFAAMSAVTVVAFVMALHDDEAVVAVVGTIGGIATPFLLDVGSRRLSGLVVYTCLVVAGAASVFARRGWRDLLWIATIGGWLVFATAAAGIARAAVYEAGVLQAGIAFHALATWWLSVVRETLSARDPQRWRPASIGLGVGFEWLTKASRTQWAEQPHLLTLSTPVAVLVVSAAAWNLGEKSSGWLALWLAVVWATASGYLHTIRREVAARIAATHAAAAAVMLAFATSLLLEGDSRRVGVAAEALALVIFAQRSRNRLVAVLGHLLFLGVGAITFWRLWDAIDTRAWGVRGADVADLAVIAALTAAAWIQSEAARASYVIGAQALLLAWFARVLGSHANGAALVTAAWFINAVVVIVAGLRFDDATVRTAGAAVMTLTMSKLFLNDMATVDALWRIVTFLAFGSVLLGLGYAFPSLWRRRR